FRSPEPDLPPIRISDAMLAAARKQIGELPQARRARYAETLQLNVKDAEVLTEHKALGDYFEKLVAAGTPAKAAANWIISDCQGLLKEKGLEISNCGITPAHMAGLLKQIEEGTINRATA